MAMTEYNKRWTADELAFDAKLRDFIEKHRVKWEAKFARKGRLPTKRERDDFLLWEAMTEDTEWDKFYGEPVE
jgi:cysteinyl-tRNA synthetase